MLFLLGFSAEAHPAGDGDEGEENTAITVRKTLPATRRVAGATVNERLPVWWSQHGIKLIILLSGILYLFVYFSRDMLVSVDSGHVGVLWKRFGGTVVDKTYPEGLHGILPWNKMYLYDVRMQEIEDAVEVLSADGDLVNMVLVTRFFPNVDHIIFLHQKVGPDYVNKIVRPEIVSGIQRVIGNYTADSLEASGAAPLTEDIDRAVRNRIDEDYIALHSIIVTQLKLQNRYRWRYKIH